MNKTFSGLLAILLSLSTLLAQPAFAPPRPVQQIARPAHFSQSDDAFLEDLSRRTFTYFIDQADANTGLVLDRARSDGSPHDETHRNTASIAATGFGLTALCIAAERGWIARRESRARVHAALTFFAERAVNEHGWFYHWMDYKTGARQWNSEISSIDSALLLAGILTARQCFSEDPEIVRLATKIYNRVDFRWMLNGDPLLLSHGWKPEIGFLRPRWDTFSEDTILYLLAIGSPTHSISPRSWYALWRDRYRYEGFSYFTSIGVPLFMHQYAHAWVDFRSRREVKNDRIDYFENSINATLAHRAFCLNLAREFPAFGPNMWGITASDSVKGYVVWGGPPADPQIDGTLVPSAAAGSLMFTPRLSLAVLKTMREKFGDRIYGRYGFIDAFNPERGWVDSDVIGINLGITLLSTENARTENVWRWFMRNHEITRAMRLIGLQRSRKRQERSPDTDLKKGVVNRNDLEPQKTRFLR